MTTLTVHAALANIRHDMTETQKAEDIALFGGMLVGTYIAAGCEIDNPVSRKLWRRIGTQRIGGNTETPVVFSADWTVLAGKVLSRTAGQAGFDPPRKTVFMRVRHVPTGITVSGLFTHMDHEAFNGPTSGRSSRLARWSTHFAKDRHLVWRRRLAGDVVVHMGDLNNGRTVVYGQGQQTVHPVPGVMQIAVLAPFRRRVHVSLGRRVIETGHTDHPLIAVPITIRKG
jgi:hypothetical protein